MGGDSPPNVLVGVRNILKMDLKEEKIIRFLQNRSTPAESEEVINLLKQADHDPEIRRILGTFWQKNNIKIASGKVDLTNVLDRIHHQINKSEASAPPVSSAKFKQSFQLSSILYKVAAVLFLPLLITTVWSLSTNKSFWKEQTTWVELTTPVGAKMNFELPDGSKVWLNDCSKIKYPSHFSGSQREVYFEGEAFFNISKNEKMPFIVKNKAASVKVTGTTFNIRAYPDDVIYEATLNTGKIELEISNGIDGNLKIPMNPGEQVSVNTQSNQVDKKQVEADEFNAWINGKLLFRDTPLDEAIKKLERWYNADIRLDSPELGNILITATFQEEKLSQALDLLSFATPIKYSISPRKRKEDGTYTKQIITISKR